jgi:hypothetical protein
VTARTAVATADAHEEGARRALLRRLATDLSVVAEPYLYHWTCCWLSYTGPRGERWAWRMCGGEMPGHLPGKRCGHWHHATEVFMA